MSPTTTTPRVNMDTQAVITFIKAASVAALKRVGVRVERAAKKGMKKGGRVKIGSVRVSIPSEPGTPPHVQTGNLRASITSATDNSKDAPSVVIGAIAKYGKVHEHGGTVRVPAHTAHVKEHERRVKNRTGKGRKKTLVQVVHAHDRHVPTHTAHYPARPFMQPALAKVKAEIMEEFKGAMAKK